MRSSTLRICSFAKINLALAVLGPRGDGFHEIRTVYQSIDLHDELELRESDVLEVHCQDLSGVAVADNLVWKSAKELCKVAPVNRGASITLKKNVPAGAGLGGGSSNAAATLLGLCRLWNLTIPQPDLLSIAARLGSDVPFFLMGGTALGVGRGEQVYPLPQLSSVDLVVIFPAVHISTAEAYRSLSLQLTSVAAARRIWNLCSRLSGDLSCLAEIFNDFETSILPAYPVVQEAKELLKSRGATVTLMSGSGSSVFGFFPSEESALAASRDVAREGWRVFPAKTLSRGEYLQRMFR